MVFFKHWKGMSRPLPASPPLHPRVEPQPPAPVPAELETEDGTAYLRLLIQLASCGIDAAGPPLLQVRTRP